MPALPLWILQLPWKWILIILSVVGIVVGAYNIGHSRGVHQTTLEFEHKEAKALADAVKTSQKQQGTKNAAEVKDLKTTEKVKTVFVPIEKKVNVYVQTPAAKEPCFTPTDDGAAIMRNAIDAANSAIADPTR